MQENLIVVESGLYALQVWVDAEVPSAVSHLVLGLSNRRDR
jgi:hypothetical protein